MMQKVCSKKRIAYFLCALLFTFMVGGRNEVYAQPSGNVIQEGVEGSQESVLGDGDVDVDGYLDSDKKNDGNSSSAQKPSSTTTVGNGLNDKLAQNAKTGDYIDWRICGILLLSGAGICVVLMQKRRKVSS